MHTFIDILTHVLVKTLYPKPNAASLRFAGSKTTRVDEIILLIMQFTQVYEPVIGDINVQNYTRLLL